MRKELKEMQLGQSLLVDGLEIIKTKKGFYSTSGFKYLQNELIERYENKDYEII